MTDDDELYARVREAEHGVLTTRLGLASHERECGIRYGHINTSIQNINSSVDSMKNILLWVGGALLAGMAGILVKLVFFPGG